MGLEAGGRLLVAALDFVHQRHAVAQQELAHLVLRGFVRGWTGAGTWRTMIDCGDYL
jgi:hypothetical protein